MGNPPSKEQAKTDLKSLTNSEEQKFSQNEGSNGYTSFSIEKLQEEKEKPDPGIITVIAHHQEEEQDKENALLDRLPIVIPVIPNSIDVKWLWSKYKVTDDGLDASSVISACSDVQKFFKKLSNDVVGKQKRIAEKIVSVEKRSSVALQGLNTQSNDTRYVELQLREVDRIAKTIAAINQQLQIALEQAERLYEALPPDEVMDSPPWWTPSQAASTPIAEVLSVKTEEAKLTEEKIFQAASKIDTILKSPKSPIQKDVPLNLHNSLSPEYSLDFDDGSPKGK